MSDDSAKRFHMKTAPFLFTGILTLIAFSIAPLSELTGLYFMFFGPAITFALVVVCATGARLSINRCLGVGAICIGADYLGASLNGHLGNILGISQAFRLYLGASVAAYIVLIGFAFLTKGARKCISDLPKALFVGAAAAVSVLPIIYPAEFYFPRLRYLGDNSRFGIHILLWYVIVGPIALHILNEKRLESTSPKASRGTGEYRPDTHFEPI